MSQLRKRLIGELALRGRSERTIESYVGHVYRLAKHYGRSPDLLSLDQIRDYLRHLSLERGLSPNSVNVALNAIVFLYREVLGWRMEGQLEGVKRPRIRKSLPKVYSQEEVYRLIGDGCLGRPKAELLLMGTYSAGLRVSEACSLKWRDIRWDRGMLLVDRGKGGKDRYLPLSPVFAERLGPYRKIGDAMPGGPVFASRHGPAGRPITANTARRYYNLALERSGVARQGGVHCLRHSYATHQLERGVDINTLSKLLGHESVQTTMIYLHVVSARIDKAGTPLEDLYRRFGGEGGRP